jgi:hypothetical protein
MYERVMCLVSGGSFADAALTLRDLIAVKPGMQHVGFGQSVPKTPMPPKSNTYPLPLKDTAFFYSRLCSTAHAGGRWCQKTEGIPSGAYQL